MRTLSAAIKVLVPIAAIMALMAVPSMASASSAYWGEYDWNPIGGSWTSEDVVTADVSGSLTATSYGTGAAWGSVTCTVAGEIALSNDWDDPAGPATNRLVSLALTGSVGSSCMGSTSAPCQLSNVSFSGFPWAGNTEFTASPSYITDFSGVSLVATFRNGGAGCSGSGPTFAMGNVWSDVMPIEDGGPASGGCVTGFDLDGSEFSGGSLQSPLPANVSGQLDIDLDTLEGLSTQDGGPCVTITPY